MEDSITVSEKERERAANMLLSKFTPTEIKRMAEFGDEPREDGHPYFIITVKMRLGTHTLLKYGNPVQTWSEENGDLPLL